MRPMFGAFGPRHRRDQHRLRVAARAGRGQPRRAGAHQADLRPCGAAGASASATCGSTTRCRRSRSTRRPTRCGPTASSSATSRRWPRARAAVLPVLNGPLAPPPARRRGPSRPGASRTRAASRRRCSSARSTGPGSAPSSSRRSGRPGSGRSPSCGAGREEPERVAELDARCPRLPHEPRGEPRQPHPGARPSPPRARACSRARRSAGSTRRCARRRCEATTRRSSGPSSGRWGSRRWRRSGCSCTRRCAGRPRRRCASASPARTRRSASSTSSGLWRRGSWRSAGISRSTRVAQPAPLLDLFGSLHDRLYARLFLS